MIKFVNKRLSDLTFFFFFNWNQLLRTLLASLTPYMNVPSHFFPRGIYLPSHATVLSC